MTHSIKHILVASFGFCVLLILGLVAFHAWTLRTLERLYQEALKRSVDMEVAVDAQAIGEDLYLIIANAVINRDMETTARQWDAAKRNSLAKLQKVAGAAETAEVKVRVNQAHEAFDAIVASYEQEMLPLLQRGAAVPGPIEKIDARIDRRIEDIDKALQWVAKSMSDDNQRAAGEFHAVLLNTNRLGLIVSLVGIVAALSGFVVTTRLIAGPLSEMTRAAMEVGKGNYQIELTQQSGGATGALADAFKGMLEEVKRRTAEMERSNERLLIEVSDRKRAEAQLQQAYDELQATSRVAAMARDIRVGERMSDEDLEEVALVLKMTQSATNARQCGLRLLVEVRRAREVERRLTA